MIRVAIEVYDIVKNYLLEGKEPDATHVQEKEKQLQLQEKN